jgi:hypothetical protein
MLLAYLYQMVNISFFIIQKKLLTLFYASLSLFHSYPQNVLSRDSCL